jgi:hypothetical protein
VSEVDEARAFLHRRLGPDWALLLIQADAIVGPDATNEEVVAAQQRAIELVSEVCGDWSLQLRESVAEAWQSLWRG